MCYFCIAFAMKQKCKSTKISDKNRRKKMKIWRRFFLACIILILLNLFCKEAGAQPIRTIVIDAGHGGHDPGAVGVSGTHEKDVVLDVALRLGKMIQKNCSDVKVMYTRSTDVFVELYKRAEIANRNKADLFISIHCNSAPSAAACGTETFVMGVDKTNANMAIAQKENSSILKETDHENNYEGFDPYSPESYIIFSLLQNAYLSKSTHFANSVQKSFTRDLHRFDRGVKQAPFLVLWRTTMPSVLIELGFLSNRDEEAYLVSEKGKDEICSSIYKAVAELVKAQGGTAAGMECKAEKPAAETVKAADAGVSGETETARPEQAAEPQAQSQPEKAADVLVYRVQFATTTVKKPLDDYAFRGLPKVQCQPAGKAFVYTAGEEATYEAAQEVLKAVKAKGNSDAFIIALLNGKRIGIEQAKKIEKR